MINHSSLSIKRKRFCLAVSLAPEAWVLSGRKSVPTKRRRNGRRADTAHVTRTEVTSCPSPCQVENFHSNQLDVSQLESQNEK